MKLTISHKLVLAFLGLTVLVLIATLGLARWSFEQGFIEYVNSLEQRRLEMARADFEQEYLSAGGSWASMTQKRFDTLLRNSLPQKTIGGPGPGGMPPPGEDAGRPPPGRDPGPRPRHPPGADERGPPTALYDAENRLIVGGMPGFPGAESIRVAIYVDGEKVGELRSELQSQIRTAQETAFSKQQLNASWVIGIVSLALALGLSLLLARALLAPVRRMISNVDLLSNGNYSARLNENRSDELGHLMANLDRLGNTLDESRSARRRWLADISHELRTPVTVLTGELEAMQDGLRNFDQQQVASLQQEVERLRYLVDDLYELSVSDLGGLRYSFATVDLKECLDAAVEAVRKRASERGIDFSVRTVNVFVNADLRRMDQLFHNLLENSLAYTDAPGRVEVTLSQVGNRALVEIQDTPPGVSDADCEQLFEPLFRQEASRSRRTGGAGLGLTICRKIVDAHGGVITAAPAALGGLYIRIEIPATNEDG